jgi:hypothetical protein
MHVLVGYNRAWFSIWLILLFDMKELGVLFDLKSRLKSIQEGLLHEALVWFLRLYSIHSLRRGYMLHFNCTRAFACIPNASYA